MLTTWRMIFPSVVEHSCERLSTSPWKCIGFGLLVVFAFSLPALMLIALPFGPAKLLGWSLVAGGLMLASLGASGLASLIGERMGQISGPSRSEVSVFIRGAVALELAAAFPIIGWLLFIPMSTVAAAGAAGFAVLNWMPRAVHADASGARTRADTATVITN
jgi:hypothetical protein